jgi:hypothetical protein
MNWQPMLGFKAEQRNLEDPAVFAPVLAPLGVATGLPPVAYRSSVFARLEDEKLWTRAWVPVGAHARIPNEGDLLPFTVGDHGVHVRREAGSLNAYFNFAQHGGCRFVPRQCQTGNKTNCFYTSCGHSRDRDVIASNPDGSEPPEMYMYVGNNPAKRVAVPVRAIGPLAFVGLDPESEPAELQLGEIAEWLADQERLGLRPLAHLTVEARCNWKSFVQQSLGEAVWAGFPNLAVFHIDGCLVTAIAQPVGPERTTVHADVFATGERSSVLPDTERVAQLASLCRERLRQTVARAEDLHAALAADGSDDVPVSDPKIWAFQRALARRLVTVHQYVERPLYAMPGRASNAGVNAGPF